MGTRGAVGFILDGKEKITYNHFDSYPSGLGNEVLDFLHSIPFNSFSDFKKFKKQVEELELIDERNTPTEEQKQKCRDAGTIDLGVGRQSEDDWYCLLRKAQGDLGQLTEIGLMIDNSNFLKDSLFCEWAYIINLDTNKLEVYQGFNKTPNGAGRYASQFIKYDHRDEIEYYGVTLITEIGFFDLPKKFEIDYDDETEKQTLKLIYTEEFRNFEIELD